MDDQDLQLIRILIHDPRATYREIAVQMGMSVQAVHRRIQLLQESKIIMGFTVTLSAPYLEAVPVTLLGRSPSRPRKEIIEALEGNDSIAGVLFGSGGALVIYALLRKVTDLEALIDEVRAATGMGHPWVGFESIRSTGARPSTISADPLSPLDRRIIASLATDSRKASTEVAKELGVTAATIGRRLERLEEIGALEFVTMLHPGFSGDIVAVVQADLQEGADRGNVIARLRSQLGATADYYHTFVNVPERVSFVAWTKSLRDLEVALDQVLQTEGVRQAVPDIIFTGWYHPTWRDRLVAGR